MKSKEFDQVVNDVPVIVPIFRVTKVPYWAAKYVQVGDEIQCDFRSGSFRANGVNLRLGPSYIEFVEYRQISGTRCEIAGCAP